MKVAIDFASFDQLRGTGQHRYVVDLVHGLAEIDSPTNFLIVGSTPHPTDEVAHLMQSPGTRWSYRQLAPSKGRGAYYWDRIRLSLLLREEKVRVFHASHTLLPLMASCAVVITIHDLMFELFDEYREALQTRPYRLYKAAVKNTCARAIAISRQTADDLQRLWGVNPEKIDVVHHGTQQRSVQVPHCEDRPETQIVISAPFNLEPRKNLVTLLEAMAKIKPEWPELKLTLFGRAAVTPDRERRFQEQVDNLGLHRSIVLTGYLEDHALRQLYGRSRLFVFPSLYEGFGLPLLEAMACGACVVARNASAMAEVVGEAGILVETANAESLAASMDSALRKPEFCRSLGQAAQTRAGHFTIRRMAEKTLEVYRRAAAKKLPAVQAQTTSEAVGSGVHGE